MHLYSAICPFDGNEPPSKKMFADHVGLVRFWVIEPRLVDGLDERLLRRLLEWFGEEWAFEQIYFHVYEKHSQQRDMIERCGLRQVAKLDLAGRGGLYLLYKPDTSPLNKSGA